MHIMIKEVPLGAKLSMPSTTNLNCCNGSTCRAMLHRGNACGVNDRMVEPSCWKD